MSLIFKVPGVLLALYVGHALVRGAVYARTGIWGRSFRRDGEPWSYWSAIMAYSLLSLALMFIF